MDYLGVFVAKEVNPVDVEDIISTKYCEDCDDWEPDLLVLAHGQEECICRFCWDEKSESYDNFELKSI